MVHQMVCVRDAKSEAFGKIACVTTIGQAIRSFEDEVNRNSPENIMNTHPEDFQLFHIGSYDDNSGETLSIVPKLLITGNEVQKINKEVWHAQK